MAFWDGVTVDNLAKGFNIYAGLQTSKDSVAVAQANATTAIANKQALDSQLNAQNTANKGGIMQNIPLLVGGGVLVLGVLVFALKK